MGKEYACSCQEDTYKEVYLNIGITPQHSFNLTGS